MAKPAKTPESFESALAELESLIQAMEGGEMPLDAALAAYKDGIELIKFCQAKLSDAETQLKVLEEGQLKPMELKNGG
ncbi:MAG: exodeoxyribonuclease VII small subunit [Paludibacterium sp.]|uniref:exodeoxyribonuclease VII small subunit n=1 Tax=Paludibacterium sp. TaxID=1917523 RepID=UPI0025CFE2EF|nr:exodeoxyribonuclease VII small subunit [Paludibacterium sp.]MBV8049293.1 exodeoxyribonuclease VII small subunit [Paludibacterium sp.]MBV8648424.1 exodeoxyribonuclease VII small subunit [Paludibacterium sp.]